MDDFINGLDLSPFLDDVLRSTRLLLFDCLLECFRLSFISFLLAAAFLAWAFVSSLTMPDDRVATGTSISPLTIFESIIYNSFFIAGGKTALVALPAIVPGRYNPRAPDTPIAPLREPRDFANADGFKGDDEPSILSWISLSVFLLAPPYNDPTCSSFEDFSGTGFLTTSCTSPDRLSSSLSIYCDMMPIPINLIINVSTFIFVPWILFASPINCTFRWSYLSKNSLNSICLS